MNSSQSLETSIAMLDTITKQAKKDEPMVRISFEVPISELDIRHCAVTASDDEHDIWGAPVTQRTYDCDVDDTAWTGTYSGPVEVDEGDLHHVEDRLIRERFES